ncbi:hypothetical protein Y1Q_0010348 [Alligator mississippiensis]|uniref:Uncharacterized protein n=1 Tax=Alligator mississippiensis TaxID=8496 RepID=A0A151NMA1_ALLMI|nr:hypothetical protein Y1Q_0010348 [Alligator mississippiensis]
MVLSSLKIYRSLVFYSAFPSSSWTSMLAFLLLKSETHGVSCSLRSSRSPSLPVELNHVSFKDLAIHPF